MLWGKECRVHMGACFSGGSRDAPAAAAAAAAAAAEEVRVHREAIAACSSKIPPPRLPATRPAQPLPNPFPTRPTPTVVFGEARHHHLRVALGAQRAALQQRLAKVHAARVHVQPAHVGGKGAGGAGFTHQSLAGRQAVGQRGKAAGGLGPEPTPTHPHTPPAHRTVR